ncbi:MAG: ABC transporter permease subunit [Chloroflexia bacterium]|nr:ABC transporter permease subunit [Chloroflexia bacterium]
MSLNTPAPATQGNYGEIFDRGYLHYDGPRLGIPAAIWALARYSMARAIGIRRPWTAKIIPFLIYAAVLIPVALAIGIRAFVPASNFLTYGEFFGAIFILEGIFVALIAPEMVSTDRHDKLLPLYFSRPIGRNAYVLAKLLGTGLLTLSVSLVPVVIMWIGNVLLASDPALAFREGLDDLGKIVVAGVLIAFYLGSIGLMISSFTGRKSVAVGVIVLGFVISESLSLALSEALRDQPDLERWMFVLSPARTIVSMVNGLFPLNDGDIDSFAVPFSQAAGVMVAVMVICSLVIFLWYQRHD